MRKVCCHSLLVSPIGPAPCWTGLSFASHQSLWLAAAFQAHKGSSLSQSDLSVRKTKPGTRARKRDEDDEDAREPTGKIFNFFILFLSADVHESLSGKLASVVIGSYIK